MKTFWIFILINITNDKGFSNENSIIKEENNPKNLSIQVLYGSYFGLGDTILYLGSRAALYPDFTKFVGMHGYTKSIPGNYIIPLIYSPSKAFCLLLFSILFLQKAFYKKIFLFNRNAERGLSWGALFASGMELILKNSWLLGGSGWVFLFSGKAQRWSVYQNQRDTALDKHGLRIQIMKSIKAPYFLLSIPLSCF